MFLIRDYYGDAIICPSANNVMKVLTSLNNSHVAIEFTRPSGVKGSLFVSVEYGEISFTYNKTNVSDTLTALECSLSKHKVA